MSEAFISYAHQNVPRKKVIKYARQYEGVDMAKLIGADEENFPFLRRVYDDHYALEFWNIYHGETEYTNEDPVMAFAIVKYLLENGYPILGLNDSSEELARQQNWSQKPWKSESDAL